jgi:CrcB protein
MSISTIIAVGSGGFIGAVLRAFAIGWVNKLYPHTLPLGTLFVNVGGSFLLGLLFGFFYTTNFFSPTMKSFLTTGLLGAMTTYSTFALESFFLFQGGSIWYGIVNILLNVCATIVFAGVGYLLVVKFAS